MQLFEIENTEGKKEYLVEASFGLAENKYLKKYFSYDFDIKKIELVQEEI